MLECGDLGRALVDFDCVLDPEPDRLDARINRAGPPCEPGRYDAARQDVDAAHRHAGDGPRPLTTSPGYCRSVGDAEVFVRRACLTEFGDQERAGADLLCSVESAPGRAGEIAALMPASTDRRHQCGCAVRIPETRQRRATYTGRISCLRGWSPRVAAGDHDTSRPSVAPLCVDRPTDRRRPRQGTDSGQGDQVDQFVVPGILHPVR